MHKKSMEAAAHLEQVEKSSDMSESDSDDGPSSRSSISATLIGQLSQQRLLVDQHVHNHGSFVLPKLYEQ
ncbi:hypothetical protein TELCIR_23559, partial [Teladorsagia circumcincta]